jgi:antitoxin component of MazEF toxin-antitoxin module
MFMIIGIIVGSIFAYSFMWGVTTVLLFGRATERCEIEYHRDSEGYKREKAIKMVNSWGMIWPIALPFALGITIASRFSPEQSHRRRIEAKEKKRKRLEELAQKEKEVDQQLKELTG